MMMSRRMGIYHTSQSRWHSPGIWMHSIEALGEGLMWERPYVNPEAWGPVDGAVSTVA